MKELELWPWIWKYGLPKRRQKRRLPYEYDEHAHAHLTHVSTLIPMAWCRCMRWYAGLCHAIVELLTYFLFAAKNIFHLFSRTVRYGSFRFAFTKYTLIVVYNRMPPIIHLRYTLILSCGDGNSRCSSNFVSTKEMEKFQIPRIFKLELKTNLIFVGTRARMSVSSPSSLLFCDKNAHTKPSWAHTYAWWNEDTPRRPLVISIISFVRISILLFIHHRQH